MTLPIPIAEMDFMTRYFGEEATELLRWRVSDFTLAARRMDVRKPFSSCVVIIRYFWLQRTTANRITTH